MDKYLSKNKIDFVRYADDFVILSTSEQSIINIKTKHFLVNNLLIKLNMYIL